MLELVTAMPPIHKNKYIVCEVQKSVDKNDMKYYGLADLMDPFIRYGPPIKGFKAFVELALQCVEEASINRPTMGEVVKELEVLVTNDGLSRNWSLTSSSARFPMHTKDVIRNSFDYSGAYSFSTQIQPK